jgi:hypothetical protein
MIVFCAWKQCYASKFLARYIPVHSVLAKELENFAPSCSHDARACFLCTSVTVLLFCFHNRNSIVRAQSLSLRAQSTVQPGRGDGGASVPSPSTWYPMVAKGPYPPFCTTWNLTPLTTDNAAGPIKGPTSGGRTEGKSCETS